MSENIMNALPSVLRTCAAAAKEKGVSSWLSALPIEQHGFALHKGDFRDAVALRYGWPLKRVPEQCACGQQFSVHHALICRCGGFILQRHNQVCDLTANALCEVAANVIVEPLLQPLNGENLRQAANNEDSSRVAIRASGFWGNTAQDAFFDVGVFYPFPPTY